MKCDIFAALPGHRSCLLRPVFVLLLLALACVVQGVNYLVDHHLEMGEELLDAGKFMMALSHYNEAVVPNDFRTYWGRATVYLELGRIQSALGDLDRVLDFEPSFSAALMKRGNLLLKQGKLKDSARDFKKVRNLEPDDDEAWRKVKEIRILEGHIDTARFTFKREIYQTVINELEKPVELCPWNPEMREMRAESYMAQGDYDKAMEDLGVLVQLTPDNARAHLQMSLAYYHTGEDEKSRLQIRKCLDLNSAHKECVSHHRKVKQLVKQLHSVQRYRNNKEYKECVTAAYEVMKTEPNVTAFTLRANTFLCHCHAKLESINGVLTFCQKVIRLDPDNVEAMLNKAKALVDNEDYEAAIEEIEAIQGKYGNSSRAKAILREAKNLQSQSKKLDYYEILCVGRDADSLEITKAYRKMAGKWHPDKHTGFEKERAHKKFIKIGEAKDILTDPEKRRQFDARSR